MCSCGVFDRCFDVTEASGSSYSAFSKYLPEESWQHGWTSSNKAKHQWILLDLLTPQQTAALQNIQDEEEHEIAAQELHDITVGDRFRSTRSSCFLMSLICLHMCTGGHLLQIQFLWDRASAAARFMPKRWDFHRFKSKTFQRATTLQT